ncbi:MAG: enoyl-CoA hydratase/isomerase family protein [Acidobacteriota bacterium]|nr:enoyl-CoA hydratase/isomerase family protein [Bryobacteraceae bacterium CoA2 C42]MCA2965940.1 enoyl-CoA hydratase/isomerase family protein [Acidobacteriaceae bacterium]
MSPILKLAQEGKVRRLTLARPEKANALNRELRHALLGALHEAEEDPATAVLLLDAEGQIFCSGVDLDEDPDTDPSYERLFSIGSRLTKPIVAAVQGPALTGGVGLLANCHCVVAAMGSSFGLTEMRVGMFPVILFRSLARAVGQRRALEWALTGRIFQTDEALRAGLIHAVAPQFEIDDRANALAAQIASFPPPALRAGLSFANHQAALDDEAAGRLAVQLRNELAASPEYAEGLAALKEKRPPAWATRD